MLWTPVSMPSKGVAKSSRQRKRRAEKRQQRAQAAAPLSISPAAAAALAAATSNSTLTLASADVRVDEELNALLEAMWALGLCLPMPLAARAETVSSTRTAPAGGKAAGGEASFASS